METFLVKFWVGHLDFDVIVTAFDHHRQFKVEMVTNESEPILLTRSEKGEWKVARTGPRKISQQEFLELEKAIDAHLDKVYGAKSMLVLTDFSEAALNAVKYAAALSHQVKTTRIILYHSHERLPIVATAFIPLAPESIEPGEKCLEKLNELKNQIAQLVPEQTAIDIRNDDRALIEAVNMIVEQEQVGLVVMGIKGKSNLEMTLIGSNTITAARECFAPLLIVPSQSVFSTIKKVVFACNLKKVSKTTPIHAIKTFVQKLNAELFILNVDPNGHNPDRDMVKEMADLHSMWNDEKPQYCYLRHEDIAQGIVDFAKENEVQLIITVPKEYGFFENIFHRSITTKLAYHTHLPLLVFKREL